MYFEKRYLQFNDLVFDGYDMISDYDEPITYKGSSTAYTNGHGSYMPFKTSYLYVSERQVNMTITLKLKKLPCEHRTNYVKFAEQELGRPGRLWAIKNNELIWSFARVNNIRPVNSGRQNEVEYDIEFIVPGGVWHKANKQKTFLLPYNVCSFMDCKEFAEYNPCEFSEGETECDGLRTENKAERRRVEELCCTCCLDDVSADMALCYHQNELQAFYGCDTPYQLLYSCSKASEYLKADAFGQVVRIRDMCIDSTLSGRFYSDTDIPTEEVTLTIIGNMVNPRITINDNTNVIQGEYDGTLIIEPSGDVYFKASDCCDAQLLDPSVWEVPEDMIYGWTINPLWNGIIVEMNLCCSVDDKPRIYIDHSAITL